MISQAVSFAYLASLYVRRKTHVRLEVRHFSPRPALLVEEAFLGVPACDLDDPATVAAVSYANELGVSNTPYLLIVDGGGFITWRNKGYAEQGVLKREVERATR